MRTAEYMLVATGVSTSSSVPLLILILHPYANVRIKKHILGHNVGLAFAHSMHKHTLLSYYQEFKLNTHLKYPHHGTKASNITP